MKGSDNVSKVGENGRLHLGSSGVGCGSGNERYGFDSSAEIVEQGRRYPIEETC